MPANRALQPTGGACRFRFKCDTILAPLAAERQDRYPDNMLL
jgi:hypothetical protein